MSQILEIKGTPKLSKPEHLLQVGKVLKEFIVKNRLSTEIGGKSYAHVDAWKFAGATFGLAAIVGKVKRLHDKEMIRISYAIQTMPSKTGSYQKEVPVYMGDASEEEAYQKVVTGKKITREIVKRYYAYECECEIINLQTQKRVGYGTGLCSNMEIKKLSFDEYSVSSMAQTRAIGKAYRNLLGYIMNEAGHQSTPAEEMEEDHIKEEVKSGQKSTKPQMTKPQINAVLLKIQKKEVTELSMVESSFDLTEEQVNLFQTMIKNRK